jgi:hypothetical protein
VKGALSTVSRILIVQAVDAEYARRFYYTPTSIRSLTTGSSYKMSSVPNQGIADPPELCHVQNLVARALQLISEDGDTDDARECFLCETEIGGVVPPNSILEAAFEVARAFWKNTVVPWNELNLKTWQALEAREG